MRRSLRWRLQAWHAMILLLVVAGSGTSFYLVAARARLDEIDAELLSGARVMEGVLRAMIPPGRRPPIPPFGPPPFGPPPFGPPGRQGIRTSALALPNSLLERYPQHQPYLVIRRPNGEILRADPTPPESPPDDEVGPGREWHARRRGMFREVTLMGPGRTQITVGRSIVRELGEMHRLAWRLAIAGLAVFSAGLAGGWWLSSRAVRPIQGMSEALAQINARRLSERIDVEGIDSELAGLAEMLNEMLGRLEISFEQQARFTADASHELRTPLSVILAHIELALSRPRSIDEYREALTTCARAAGRMKAMVDDLLTLARADVGQLELKAEPVDLAAIAEESVEMLQTLADRRGVTILLEGDEAIVKGDSGRLGQVAVNLLTNAILYNRPGGRVAVSTALEDGEAVLIVTDTGVGILESDLPMLYQRFYRADPARSREHGGSGLGLAICRSIVEAHGGRIEVASRSGEGTTVNVRLPTAPIQ